MTELTECSGINTTCANERLFPFRRLRSGMRVRYTRAHLQCIGAAPTDDMWHREGVLVEPICPDGMFAVVRWDGDPAPVRVSAGAIGPRGAEECLTLDAPGYLGTAPGQSLGQSWVRP